MSLNRKLIVYIATSVDGFIAGKDDNLDFLSLVEQDGEDYGYQDFIKNVDTVIMGRKTYDKICTMVSEFPHKDKTIYVITRNNALKAKKINFYTQPIQRLIEDLKRQPGKHIFCDGGSELIHQLLEYDLVDEFYISIIPILLGDGIPLFKQRAEKTTLKLIDAKSYKKGLVQLHYIRDKKQGIN